MICSHGIHMDNACGACEPPRGTTVRGWGSCVMGPARPAIEERYTREGAEARRGAPCPYHPGSAAATWWKRGNAGVPPSHGPDYTWPPKACPCNSNQKPECQEHGCKWERDPSLVPEALRTRGVAPVQAPSSGPNALELSEAIHAAAAAIYFDDSADYVRALWTVLRKLAPAMAELMETDPGSAFLRSKTAPGVVAAQPLPVAWFHQHVMKASNGIVESWLSFDANEEPDLKTEPGTSFVVRTPLYAAPKDGVAGAPAPEQVSPALARQRRLVATLPQTAEQVALLTPCAALGKGVTPVRCGHCGQTVTPGGACARGVAPTQGGNDGA